MSIAANQNSYMPHWLGFARLHDMLAGGLLPAAAIGFKPEVLVMAVTHTPAGSVVRSMTNLDVCMLDSERVDCVRYWRMRLGALTLVEGAAPDEDARVQLLRLSWAAEDFMGRHLAQLGYRVSKGTIARPADLLLIEGIADDIGFDPKLCQFFWDEKPNTSLQGT